MFLGVDQLIDLSCRQCIRLCHLIFYVPLFVLLPCVVGINERNEHGLRRMMLNLDEAMSTKLFFQCGRKFNKLLLRRVILYAGEFLKRYRHKNRNVADTIALTIMIYMRL